MATTTSLRSRLLILSPVPAAAATSLRLRSPSASPSLSSKRRTPSPATTPSMATCSTSASSSSSSAPTSTSTPSSRAVRDHHKMDHGDEVYAAALEAGAGLHWAVDHGRQPAESQDIWDSIKNNEYFSFEGLWDVFKQLRIYKTPDRETPNYLILERTANYEVRSYAPFLIVELKGDKLTGSSGFNNVTGYIFGKNVSSEKILMTTPVFTQASDDKLSDVSIQIVLPMNKDLNSLPAPNAEAVTLRKVEGGIVAVKKFSGRPKEEIVLQKEQDLRSQLLKDGLKPQQGCLLARYNDPRTHSFLTRNEVLIWLNDFTLELYQRQIFVTLGTVFGAFSAS